MTWIEAASDTVFVFGPVIWLGTEEVVHRCQRRDEVAVREGRGEELPGADDLSARKLAA